MACATADKHIIISPQNADEASMVDTVTVLAATNLLQVTAHLHQVQPIAAWGNKTANNHPQHPEIRDVIGQKQAKRALEIAACGGHHLLLFGPPGTGKSI